MEPRATLSVGGGWRCKKPHPRNTGLLRCTHRLSGIEDPFGSKRYDRRLPACEAAGVPGLTFHDLRRANATALVAERVDIKTAQTRLGHADPRTTLGIYARATGEGDRRAADAVERRLMRPDSNRRRDRLSSAKADVP